MKKTVRFTNQKNASSFAEAVGGELRDIRSNEERKSDFKVVYNQGSRGGDRKENDFDSPINSGSWHTAEDL